MIANFVGDVLFTDKKDGLTSLVASVEVKKRNPIVQFLVDFINYIKKKFSGQNVPIEVLKLEKRFGEMFKTVSKNTRNEIMFSLSEMGLEKFDKQSLNNIKMQNGILINSIDELKQNIKKLLAQTLRVICMLEPLVIQLRDKLKPTQNKAYLKINNMLL